MDSTILIVDDNPKNLQVVGSILKNEGFPIELALNGKDAIKWVEKKSFDLILLDVMMPEMDGFQVCNIIRSKFKDDDIPIVFLTALADRENILKGFETGGQDYISKPFDSQELLVRVKTQIELKQSKEKLRALNKNLDKKVNERTQALQETNKALTESEEKYRYALEAANDGIWDWNLDKDEVELSVAFYKMLGYENNAFPQTREEIHKRTHPEDLRERDQPKYIQDLKRKNEQFLKDEYRLKTITGKYKWLRVQGQVVERNDKNEISRMIGTHTDITSEKRKNHDILEAVLKTEDRERSRISKDIHDGLQQTLTVSMLNFQSAQKELGSLSPGAIEKFKTGWEYLQKGITESRVVAHSLMPKAIVDYGLVSACESLVELMNSTIEGTHFSFINNFGDTRLMDQQIEITLYRILQEGINNIIKYAKAAKVEIQLKSHDDVILLTIEDDGVGFDMNQVSKGLGLQSIQNRLEPVNGFFEITSKPTQGTSIIVEIEKRELLDSNS